MTYTPPEAWQPCRFSPNTLYRIVYSPDGDYVMKKCTGDGTQRRQCLMRFLWEEEYMRKIPPSIKLVQSDPTKPVSLDNIIAVPTKSGRKPNKLSTAEQRWNDWNNTYQPVTGLVAALQQLSD